MLSTVDSGTHGESVSVILVDLEAPVVDVAGGDHTIGDAAGAKAPGRLTRDAAAGDQLDLVGTPEVEVSCSTCARDP